MPKKISDSDYEKALLGYLEQEFPPPFFEVRGTRGGVKYTIKGAKSGVARQIDAAVHRRGNESPILIADAKNRGRKLDITAVDAFSSFLQDVGVFSGATRCSAPRGCDRAALCGELWHRNPCAH